MHLKYVLFITVAVSVSNCNKLPERIVPNHEQDIPPVPPAIEQPPLNMAGGNWACPEDNYTDNWLVLSGLKSTDNYATVQATADKIYTAFAANGINTVRLPINPATVTETFWAAYTGTIDKALSRNMKVILCNWEGTKAKDGKVDDMAKFWNMWAIVVNKYGTNGNVYFEIFNEPFGYNKTDWSNICEQWLDHFPSVAKNHVIISGTGYSTDVSQIGNDSRFSNCLLALHIYTWFATVEGSNKWESELTAKVGDHSKRTIVTEFGSGMSNGYNYFGNTINRSVAYLQGITQQFNKRKISSIYWPGYRTADTYSLLYLENNEFKVNNASGLSQVQYGWGSFGLNNPFQEDAFYKIVNRNSGAVIDVTSSAIAQGAGIVQSLSFNGSNSQQWQISLTGNRFYKITNRNSGMPLDVNQLSVLDGEKIIQWNWNSGDNQQWIINYLGSGYFGLLNRNSGKALDVKQSSKTDKESIVQMGNNSNLSQQWQLVKL